MKVQELVSTNETSFAPDAAFSIKTSAKAFAILSDNLYKNKIGSIVREVVCNGFDAHAAAGINEPLEITLDSNLMFVVRDFGKGIPDDKIQEIYCTFFHSTKEEDNDAIGCMGLGAKSPFSYTESFHVSTYIDGTQTNYLFLKTDGVPSYSLVGKIPTNEPNGVKVSVPVLSEDFSKWIKEIELFCLATKNPVKINGDEPKRLEDTCSFGKFTLIKDGTNKKFFTNSLKRFIRMGDVVYPLDVGLIEYPQGFNLSDYYILDIPIGLAEVTGSREELSYSPKTIENLAKYLTQEYLVFAQEISSYFAENELSYLDAKAFAKKFSIHENIIKDNYQFSYGVGMNRKYQICTDYGSRLKWGSFFTHSNRTLGYGDFIYYQGTSASKIALYYEKLGKNCTFLKNTVSLEDWAKFLAISESKILDSKELVKEINAKRPKSQRVKIEKTLNGYPKGHSRRHRKLVATSSEDLHLGVSNLIVHVDTPFKYLYNKDYTDLLRTARKISNYTYTILRVTCLESALGEIDCLVVEHPEIQKIFPNSIYAVEEVRRMYSDLIKNSDLHSLYLADEFHPGTCEAANKLRDAIRLHLSELLIANSPSNDAQCLRNILDRVCTYPKKDTNDLIEELIQIGVFESLDDFQKRKEEDAEYIRLKDLAYEVLNANSDKVNENLLRKELRDIWSSLTTFSTYIPSIDSLSLEELHKTMSSKLQSQLDSITKTKSELDEIISKAGNKK